VDWADQWGMGDDRRQSGYSVRVILDRIRPFTGSQWKAGSCPLS